MGRPKLISELKTGASNNRSGVSANGVASSNQGGGSTTPQPSASFIGQQASATTCSYFGQGCNPPDMALAASPQFVLQGVNTQWEVFDTAGNVQPGWPVSAQNFFGVPNVTKADGNPCDTAHLSQPFLSDPRALYDPVDGRFWAAQDQIENALGVATDCPFKAVYWVAVSSTSDPNGAWNVYEFEMSLGQKLHGQPIASDFTQLGINSQAVYFSSNMFNQSGTLYAYAELFEANKSQMEQGKADFTAQGFFNLRADGPGLTLKTGPFLADTVQPMIDLDGSTTNGVFVNTLDGPDPATGNFCGFFGGGAADACKGLAVWNLANPVAHDTGGPLPTLQGTYVPNTNPFLFAPAADQPSCNQCVAAGDLRISGTPIARHGHIYTAWVTAIDNGTQVVPGIEWAQVSLTDYSVQSGYYNFAGDAAATYPAVMPDAQGNVTMLFEHMSSDVFPEARYIVRGAGQANFTGGGVVLKEGESSYRPERCGTIIPVCRWGDYEATSFDGQGHIWFAGEYANEYQGIVPPAFGRNWGTWIGAIG